MGNIQKLEILGWVLGHSIYENEDMSPYAEHVDFCGAVILPSVTFESNFTEIRGNESKINIYSIFPVNKQELLYKKDLGYSAFLNLLIEANCAEMFDLNRSSLVETA